MGMCAAKSFALETQPDKKAVQVTRSTSTPREQSRMDDLLDLIPQSDRGLPNLLLSGKLSKSQQEAFDDKPVDVRGNSSLDDLGSAVGFACKKGQKHSAPRSPNQDNLLILQAGCTCIYGVFDGHGPHGQTVSSFVAPALVQNLAIHPQLQKDPTCALRDAFIQVQGNCVQLEHKKKMDCRLSGTTATVLLDRRLQKRPRELCLAHCGDSRAVLGYRSKMRSGAFMAMDLTADHKPGIAAEKARVEAAGGVVRRQPGDVNDRVFVKNMMYPGLAMSRSIGDTLAASVGVSSEPDVSVYEVKPGWSFVLVCSDGVWEFITSQEAVDLVGRFPPEKSHRACQELAEEARQRWIREEDGTCDDITAVCVWLV